MGLRDELLDMDRIKRGIEEAAQKKDYYAALDDLAELRDAAEEIAGAVNERIKEILEKKQEAEW